MFDCGKLPGKEPQTASGMRMWSDYDRRARNLVHVEDLFLRLGYWLLTRRAYRRLVGDKWNWTLLPLLIPSFFIKWLRERKCTAYSCECWFLAFLFTAYKAGCKHIGPVGLKNAVTPAFWRLLDEGTRLVRRGRVFDHLAVRKPTLVNFNRCELH